MALIKYNVQSPVFFFLTQPQLSINICLTFELTIIWESSRGDIFITET